jgi:hypothetical protein
MKWWIIGSLILLLAVGMMTLYMDQPLRAIAERAMNRHLHGYTIKIGALHFHPIGLSLDLEDVDLYQDAHPRPAIMHLDRWHASIHWHALFHGRLVSDHQVERLGAHITLSQIKKETTDDEPIQERGWQDAVLAIYPLKINALELIDAEVTYLDRPEAKPLRLTHLHVKAENIRNVKSPERYYPSELHVQGETPDAGRIRMDGAADFLAEPHPGVKADIVLEEIALHHVMPITGRVNVQIQGGRLSAAGHLEYSSFSKEIRLTNLLVEDLRLDYVHSASTRKSEQHVAKTVAQAAERASNHPELLLRIDQGKILTSEIGFVNEAVTPPYRLYITDTSIGMQNFSNQLSEGTAYINLTGKLMGSGQTQVHGTFRPEHTTPDFDLQVRVIKTRLKSLNDLLRAYGNFDVVGGVFSIFSELTVKDGQIRGYLKPMVKDLDIYDSHQDANKGTLQKLYEGLLDDTSDALTNIPRQEVATKADLSGPVKDPRSNTWEVVGRLIQNAFFKAILPGLEKDRKNLQGRLTEDSSTRAAS